MTGTNRIDLGSVDSDLPEGWAEIELEEISAQIQYGYTASALRDQAGPRFLRITDIQDGKVDWNSVPTCEISREDLRKYALRANDVLFARTGATTGKSFLIVSCPRDAVFASYLIRLRLRESIDAGFVSLFFNTPEYWQFISDNVAGNAQPNCNATKLGHLPVPIPPLIEQRRIVEKVEQLLARVNAARKRLASVPAILKHFRQAILAAACSGRLTADWREENSSVEPAEILFMEINAERQHRYEKEARLALAAGRRKPKHSDSNKQSRKIVSEVPDIPKTWAYFRLEELCHQVTDGTHKTPQYQTSGVRFLSVKNVRPFHVRDADIKFASEKEYRSINSRCNPEKGDVLYTKIGATYGYAAANKLDYPFSIFVSLALLKPVTPFFSTAFVEIVMNSEVVFNQARERVSGIGTPDLHLIEIRDFRIPLPPLTEQQEIVRRVEALFKLADAIEKRVATATARAEKLTQAILAKAFRGELVPTEAELARREGRSYESATALLDRIRKDRAQSKDVSRKAALQEHRRWPKRTAKRTSGR